MSDMKNALFGNGGWVTARGPACDDRDPPLLEGEHIGDKLAQEMIRQQHSVPGETQAVLSVPPTLMTTLAKAAASEGLPLAMPESMLARLDRRNASGLSEITRIFRPDGSDLVRAKAMLRLTDDPAAQRPWEEWFDFPSTLIGQILQAAPRERVGSASAALDALLGGPRRLKITTQAPRWAGSVSFAPVIAQARAISVGTKMTPGNFNHPPRQVLSIQEASILNTCHVIRVDPEQVAVLPQWEADEEAIEFGLDAELPYEEVYLDFEGEGGLAPLAGYDAGNVPITISGALMFRKPGTTHLVVAPVAWATDTELVRTDPPWSRYETCGWFVFDREYLHRPDGEPWGVGTLPLILDALDLGATSVAVSADYCANTVGDKESQPLPGYAILPVNREELIGALGLDTATHYLIWWSHLIWVAACKALAALSIVEAEEVILVDAPMERRDRKRADKRGWKIAQQVLIRPSRRRADGERTVTGNRADYSHRFWVRGHHKHFPLGTRMADVRPDQVKPCPRLDMATNCGFCRRVWTPPFIKGDPDKPLMLKTLVSRKPKRDPLAQHDASS